MEVVYFNMKDTYQSSMGHHKVLLAPTEMTLAFHLIRKYIKELNSFVDNKHLKISDVDIILMKVCGKQQQVYIYIYSLV